MRLSAYFGNGIAKITIGGSAPARNIPTSPAPAELGNEGKEGKVFSDISANVVVSSNHTRERRRPALVEGDDLLLDPPSRVRASAH